MIYDSINFKPARKGEVTLKTGFYLIGKTTSTTSAKVMRDRAIDAIDSDGWPKYDDVWIATVDNEFHVRGQKM